jgi:DNA adenine methylase
MVVNGAKNNKPFLRWAGGKNWLIKHLDQLIPRNGFKNYHEPFLGGGSVFLYLSPQRKAYLSDLNEDLISTYLAIKNDPEIIIKKLQTYTNSKDFYYSIREEKFTDQFDKAAQFIYLNQTSFNGIYRVNLRGEYNVPYGFRKKEFLEPEVLYKVSAALKNAILFSGDFSLVKSNIKKNDFIFLDPPYTVSHNDNGFIKYNQDLFSLDDQIRLSKLIEVIKRKDAYYLLTNAAHTTIVEIFEKGDSFIPIQRASLIGGKNAKRGQTTEYIFTNVKNSLFDGTTK